MDTGTKLQPGRLKRLTRAQATRVRRYETNTWPAKDSCEVNFDEAVAGDHTARERPRWSTGVRVLGSLRVQFFSSTKA